MRINVWLLGASLTLLAAPMGTAQTYTNYQYDAQGQVVTVARPANTAGYAYDAAANRTAITSDPTAPPTAGNVSPPATPLNTPLTITLAPGGQYSIMSIAAAPTKGTLSAINGLQVIYTPTTGASGADSFTYTATGPAGTSAQATVNIMIGSS